MNENYHVVKSRYDEIVANPSVLDIRRAALMMIAADQTGYVSEKKDKPFYPGFAVFAIAEQLNYLLGYSTTNILTFIDYLFFGNFNKDKQINDGLNWLETESESEFDSWFEMLKEEFSEY